MVTVPADDPLDPADAFDLLGDETRVRILETLGDAWVESWPGVLPYSTLMERVGVDDRSRAAVLGPDLGVERLD